MNTDIERGLSVALENINQVKFIGGLCGLLFQLYCDSKVSNYEYNQTLGFIKNYFKEQEVFYRYNGLRTSEKDQFVWEACLVEPRKEWLKKILNK